MAVSNVRAAMQMLVSRLQRPSPRKTEAPRRNWAPRFGCVTVAETAGRRRSRSVSLYSWVKSSYYKVKSRLSHHNQAKTLMGCRKTRSLATVANHRQGGAMTRIGDRHCVGEREHTPIYLRDPLVQT